MENGKCQIILVVHNVRSTHNVGSILRSADGLGISHVYLTGYTPYPIKKNDERLPYVRAKVDKQIHKTALGAEKTVNWTQSVNVEYLFMQLKKDGYLVAALEQTSQAMPLNEFKPRQNIALVVGNEVEGVDKSVLDKCDVHLQIPMQGKKESFNVAVATAIALYHLQLDNG